MPIDLDAVSRRSAPVQVEWTHDDALLYAIGVGAGQDDPSRELAFTTENSTGIRPQVLPTFGAILVQRANARPPIGDVDRAKILHARQRLAAHALLPVAGRALVSTRVAAIYDKGFGALVVYESAVADAVTEAPLVTSEAWVFIRDEGGFGGAPPPEEPWTSPAVPDVTVRFATRPEQALLYRLSADRNPIHSDPTAAAASGFQQPILQGMCTFGFCGRLLLHAVCGGNPARFTSLDARFVRRVVPGEALIMTGWRLGAQTRFRVANAAGATVVDDGRLIACASCPAPDGVSA